MKEIDARRILSVIGVSLVFMLAQLFSLFPLLGISYALTNIVPHRLFIGLFDSLPGMPLRWEWVFPIAIPALAFEAMHWWGRRFFFSNSKGELCIARYLIVPGMLPAIPLMLVLHIFERGYDEYGFLHRGGDIHMIFVVGLVGGLAIRGVLVALSKTAGGRVANIAAVAIAVIMLVVGL